MTNKNQCWVIVLAFVAALLAGCRSNTGETTEKDFHTSGSREADQRAEQRMSKEEQLRGEGAGGVKDKDTRPPLYTRLGSENGVRQIVSDFVDRALADPRVNWVRKGVKQGVLGVGGKASDWKPTPEEVERLKKHLEQFVAVATGGPTLYEGRQIVAAHDGMKITNPEFDATIGALKASLDVLKIANEEQKELLAVFESTRPQIVEKR